MSLLILTTACAGSIPIGEYEDSGVPDADASPLATDGGNDTGLDAGGPAGDAAGDALMACGPATCMGCCLTTGICATGATDTACGSGGAQCADCAKLGTQCKSNKCYSCTPACSGKVCGASDGCGGSCKAGSGCCTPVCSGKYCGNSDGCGGTCKAGSGCTAPSCAYQADSKTLLLYTFSGTGATAVTDLTGKHPGKIVGAGLSRGSSKTGCGKSLRFSSSTPISYLTVNDAAVWDLAVGSLDLWINFDAAAKSSEGIISRDANGTAKPGHLTIYRACNGSIVARLQDTASTYLQCSAPVNPKAWYHLGVNFGGAKGLTLDVGKLAGRTASITCGSDVIACGSSTTKGIAGNDNPWVVGAAAWQSKEASATPAQDPFIGRIDSLRISSARRAF